MVASAQRLASEVGVDGAEKGRQRRRCGGGGRLRAGGGLPAAGNLGGGGFMTIVFADGRKTFIDFREKAPLKATRDMYLGPDGEVVKGLSTRGYLVGRRARHGRRPRICAREIRDAVRAPTLIDPAIGYAENGFTLDDGDALPLDVGGAGAAQRPGRGRDLPQRRPAVRGRRAAGAEESRAHAARDPRARRRPGSTKARSATAIVAADAEGRRAHHRRGSAARSSRANCRRSPATIAATPSSPRRRRVRAA